MVPEHLRDVATASLPWRNEPDVYRSDLGERLPEGLSLPEAFSVVDLDDESAALWLRGVDVDSRPWTSDTFRRAAFALGWLAASPRVRPLHRIGSHDVVRGYGHGRLEHQVLPTLRDDGLWRHPQVAEALDPQLRARILAAADARTAQPVGGARQRPARHRSRRRQPAQPAGRAGDPDVSVLIDFGFWSQAPLGFDLSQLLLGEVQLGERPAAELPGLEEACLAAYVAGLRAEGCEVALETVRRAHALLMLVFRGLSAVPLEVMLGAPAPPTEAFGERARAARFVLDLVDASAPVPAARP